MNASRTAQFMKNHPLVSCVSFFQCLMLDLQCHLALSESNFLCRWSGVIIPDPVSKIERRDQDRIAILER